MKYIIAIILSAASLVAQETTESKIQFTASTFFQTPFSPTTEEVKPAGGIALRGIFWHGLGAQVELIQSATEDTFVDRSAAHLVYRQPVGERFGLFGFGGYVTDWEDQQHGVEAGAGVDYLLWRGVELSASCRWQKDEEDRDLIVPTLGIGYRF